MRTGYFNQIRGSVHHAEQLRMMIKERAKRSGIKFVRMVRRQVRIVLPARQMESRPYKSMDYALAAVRSGRIQWLHKER